MHNIDDKLMRLLACPICGGNLELNTKNIYCQNCKKQYLIKEEVPILLIEDRKEYKYNLSWHPPIKINSFSEKIKSTYPFDLLRTTFFRDTKIRINKLIKDDFLILDLGCRDGRYTRDLTKTATIIGLDIDIESLKTINSYNFNNFRVVLATAECSPFKNQIFDLVICAEVLEHLNLKDGEKAILKASKILKKKGLLLITTPNGETVSKAGAPSHLHHYSFQELSTLLKRHFNNVYIEGRFRFYNFLRYKHKMETLYKSTKQPMFFFLGIFFSFIYNVILPFENGFLKPNKGKYNWVAICSNPRNSTSL